MFPFTTTSSLAVEPMNLSTWYWGSCIGVKQPDHETDRSSLSSVEVRNT